LRGLKSPDRGAREVALALITCYRRASKPEMADMFWLFLVICLVSIPLSAEMARERGRSPRVWFWIAFLVGPLAPVALLLLGDSRRSVSAH
jgi:hypothetical protein